MINISFTDFVDISAKNGMSKYRNIVKIKKRPVYSPATDYYKRLREHIIEIHKGNYGKSSFLPIEEITNNQKKYLHYNSIIEGYKKFWGNKKLSWFDPPQEKWIENNVSVKINPELGLYINDQPHVIKMYFKNEPLSKARTEISLFLLHQMLPEQHNSQAVTYCILDIRKSKLIKPTIFHEGILNALRGESSYISSVWDSIQD